MNEAVNDGYGNHRSVPTRAAGFSPRERVGSLTHRLADTNTQRTATTATRTAFALLLPLLTASLTGGCAKPPATTPEDVVDYMRNAVVGAEARRLDDEHQEHATRVLAAYRAWEKRCVPMQKLCEPESLWPMDGSEWRDRGAVGKRTEIVELLIDTPLEVNDPPATAKPSEQDIVNAIARTPYAPEIKSRLEAILIKADERLLQSVATNYFALFSEIEKNNKSFVFAEGLSFSDPRVTETVRAQWRATKQAIDAYHKHRSDYVRDVLAEHPGKRDAAIDEKRTLYAMANPSQDRIHARRRLDVLVRYYDATIKSAEREKNKLETPGD